MQQLEDTTAKQEMVRLDAARREEARPEPRACVRVRFSVRGRLDAVRRPRLVPDL